MCVYAYFVYTKDVTNFGNNWENIELSAIHIM